MSIPFAQKARIGAYIVRKAAGGSRRMPLVLMLEPLFDCNLRCEGCGKVSRPREVLDRRMEAAECLDAAFECGAPVVSIPGGEPLLHPDIPLIVRELTRSGRFVYLCTNGLLVERRIREFTASPRLVFNVHIDGLKKRHDALTRRDGAFEKAVGAIRRLLSRGFRVTTNTTFYAGETPEGAARLFDVLASLGVEGMTVAPAFGFEKAGGGDGLFPERGETTALFRGILRMRTGRRWRFNHSSLYLDFLAGRRRYACSPWGAPTRNVFGWQRPCYLLEDGYAPTFGELLAGTAWERYGAGKDPRCGHCMVHCGYEATAVMDALKHPLKALRACAR